MDFVCDAFFVAVSALSGDCVDVSRAIRESRNFDAAGRRAGREDNGAANRAVHDFAFAGQPRAVFYRSGGLDLFNGSDNFRRLVFVFFDSGGARQIDTAGEKIIARFGFVSAFDFCLDGFKSLASFKFQVPSFRLSRLLNLELET